MNKTCEDCIHYPLCSDIGTSRYDNFDDEFENTTCTIFKDKSKFIELPCEVGDKVYTVVYQKVFEAEVICIMPFIFNDYVEYRGNAIITFEDPFYNDGRPLEQELFIVFGKDTFLTRKRAEKKLEELNGV